MFGLIVAQSLRNRLLVLALAFALVLTGALSLARLTTLSSSSTLYKSHLLHSPHVSPGLSRKCWQKWWYPWSARPCLQT